MTDLLEHHLLNDHRRVASQCHDVVEHPLPADQATPDGHSVPVGGGTSRNTTSFAAASKATPSCCEPSADDHDPVATHFASVVGTLSSQPNKEPQAHLTSGWLELRIWAEMHHDAQLQRIATVNRAERGGVDAGLYVPYIEVVERAENTARLGMVRCYRRVVPAPIRDWQKEQKGIGEHLLARLLGHLGHPAVATPHHWEGTGSKRTLIADEPYERTVAQLWSYCGHGDPARRKTKGMTADAAAGLGKPDLKMIVHLLSEACMKQQSGNLYRDLYEARRLVTEDRTHAVTCVRCGPSGKPAEPGSPWSKAHQHADALRIVGKEILRDLWTIGRSS